MDIFETLKKYKQLKDENLIDDEEYQKMKSAVLQQKINASDHVEYLRGLKELYDKRIITQEEFVNQKDQIIKSETQDGEKAYIKLSVEQITRGLENVKEKGKESFKLEKGGKLVISKKMLAAAIVVILGVIAIVSVAAMVGGGGGTKLPGDVKWGDDVEAVKKGASKLGATKVRQEEITFDALDAEYLGYICVISWYVTPTSSLYPHISVSYYARNNPLMTFDTVHKALEKQYGKPDTEENENDTHEVSWDKEDTIVRLYEFTSPDSNLYENVYISFDQKKAMSDN